MLARPQPSDLDAGPRAEPAETERLCVAMRTVKPIDEMIRYVVGPSGAVVPDVKRKLPGRGIWITATRDALDTAIRRKAISSAFRREVKVDAGLVVLTDRLLEQAALDALAICGKSSLAVSGFSKVEAALEREAAVALLHASDAAADGIRKLEAIRQRSGDPERVPLVTEFASEQLDLALARPNVIHAALLAGPASATFLTRHARLMRFRTGLTATNEAERDRAGKGKD